MLCNIGWDYAMCIAVKVNWFWVYKVEVAWL